MTQFKSKTIAYSVFILLIYLSTSFVVQAQKPSKRLVSGVLLTKNNDSVAGITVSVTYPSGEQKALTGEDGAFQFNIPDEPFTIGIQGKYVVTQKREFTRA